MPWVYDEKLKKTVFKKDESNYTPAGTKSKKVEVDDEWNAQVAQDRAAAAAYDAKVIKNNVPAASQSFYNNRYTMGGSAAINNSGIVPKFETYSKYAPIISENLAAGIDYLGMTDEELAEYQKDMLAYGQEALWNQQAATARTGGLDTIDMTGMSKAQMQELQNMGNLSQTDYVYAALSQPAAETQKPNIGKMFDDKNLYEQFIASGASMPGAEQKNLFGETVTNDDQLSVLLGERKTDDDYLKMYLAYPVEALRKDLKNIQSYNTERNVDEVTPEQYEASRMRVYAATGTDYDRIARESGGANNEWMLNELRKYEAGEKHLAESVFGEISVEDWNRYRDAYMNHMASSSQKGNQLDAWEEEGKRQTQAQLNAPDGIDHYRPAPMYLNIDPTYLEGYREYQNEDGTYMPAEEYRENAINEWLMAYVDAGNDEAKIKALDKVRGEYLPELEGYNLDKLRHLKPDQKKAIFTAFNNGDVETAKNLIQTYDPILNYQRSGDEIKAWEKKYNEANLGQKVGMNVQSVGQNVGTALEGVKQAVWSIAAPEELKKITAYDPVYDKTRKANKTRELTGGEIAQATEGVNIPFTDRNLLESIYHGVMSGADSFAISTLLAPLGPEAQAIAMGGISFANERMGKLEAGYSNEDANMDAWIQSFIEGVTEYIPFDIMSRNSPNAWRKALGGIYAGSVGEGVSDLGGALYDELKYGEYIDQLLVEGNRGSEASLWWKWLKYELPNAAAAAVGGLVGEVPQQTVSASRDNRQNKQFGENIRDNDSFEFLADLADGVEVSNTAKGIVERMRGEIADKKKGDKGDSAVNDKAGVTKADAAKEAKETEAAKRDNAERAEEGKAIEEQPAGVTKEDAEAAAREAEQTARDKEERAADGKETAQEDSAGVTKEDAEAMKRKADEIARDVSETADKGKGDKTGEAIKEGGVTKAEADAAVKEIEQTARDKGKRGKEGKRSKPVSNAEIGYVYREVMKSLDAASQNVVAEAFSRDVLETELAKAGFRGDMRKAADIVEKFINGKGNKNTYEALRSNQAMRKVALDFVGEIEFKEATYRGMAGELAYRASKDYVKPESTKADKGAQEATKGVDDRAIVTADDVDVSDTPESTVDGNAVTISGVKSIDADGTIMYEVTDADGNVTEVSDADIEIGQNDAGTLIVAENAKALGENGIEMVRMYKNSQDAGMYASEFKTAVQYGKEGRNAEAAIADGSFETLTKEQIKAAYRIGESGRVNTAAPTRINAKGIEVGKVDKSGIKNVPLNEKQEAAIEAGSRIARAAGFNIRFVESIADASGKYTGTDHGYWDPNTLTLTLDIHAGVNSKMDTSYAMMHTMGHELTHYIRQFADASLWGEYQRFVMDHLSKKMNNETLDDKISQLMENQPDLTRDQAIEEIIADASAEALNNITEADIRAIAETNPSLLQKLKDFINRWVKRVKAEIKKAYKGTSTDNDLVADMMDVVDEMSARWNELFVNAARNRADIAAGRADTSVEAAMNEAMNGAVDSEGRPMHSLRTMKEDKAAYRRMLTQHGKMTSAEVTKLFEAIDALMDAVEEHRAILDFGENIDSDNRSFTPVKQNSDPLYQVSVDFSTLCRKRLLQQACQERLEAEMGRAVTKAERVAIREQLIKLQQEGKQIEVACALCYVESARLKSPAQIQRFMENRAEIIRNYFARRNEAVKAQMAQAEADYRKANGIGDASLKNLPGSVAKKIRAAKNAPIANYKVSAEEQRTIDKAMSMSVSEFTTADSLWKLKREDPVLFDIYTSHVRNATKSKGIEGDTPWKAGDSKAISDELIRKMNEENGLRSQSWSDFQVYHMLDYIAAIIELSTRNAKMQTYTKVPAFVKLMGETGVMINMSLIPKAKFDGTLEYDNVEGIVAEEAFELRDRYPDTAGTICIGIDDEQIDMLLDNDDIDYVIPYHRSGMDAATRKKMRIPTWKDYEAQQNEKPIRADAGKAPKFSEWFDYKKAVYEANKANKTPKGEAAIESGDVMYGAKIAMQKAAQRYKDLCAERGLAPKFQKFADKDGYWKLLIDRKMINQKTGEIIEQKAVQPVFKEKTLLEICAEEVSRFNQNNADFNAAVNAVIDAYNDGTLGKVAKSAKVQQQVRDHENWMAVQAAIGVQEHVEGRVMRQARSTQQTNTPQFKRWFGDSKIVNPDGSPKVLYHQTNAEFNAFDVGRNGAGYLDSEMPSGIYMKDFPDTIKLGPDYDSSRQMDLYASIKNPLVFATRDDARRFWKKHVPGYDMMQLELDVLNGRYGAEYDKWESLWFDEDDAVSEKAMDESDRILEEWGEAEDTKRREMHVAIDNYLASSQYDGIILEHDQGTGGTVKTYVALKSTQVKSATKNVGQYDSENPDIRYQKRDFSKLSTREILADAMLTVANSTAEAEIIENYRKRIGKLEEMQTELEKVYERIAELKDNATKPTDSPALRQTHREEMQKAYKKAKELKEKITKADQTLISLENAKVLRDMVANVRDATRLKTAESVRKRAEERRQRDVEKARNDVREKVEFEKYRKMLLDDVKKLHKWVTAPTSKGSAPQFLREPLANLIEAIDPSSKRSLSARKVIASGDPQKVKEWEANAIKKRDKAKERYEIAVAEYNAAVASGNKDEIKTAKRKMNIAKGLYNTEEDAVKRGIYGVAEAYSKADKTFMTALEDMADVINRMADQQSEIEGGAELFEGYVDMPADYRKNFNEQVRSIKKTIEMAGEKTGEPINRMTANQVKELSRLFRTLNHSIVEMNSYLSEGRGTLVKADADSVIDELTEMKPRMKSNEALEKINSTFNWKNATPYYVFQRLGKGGKHIFERLQNGWDKMAHNSARVIEFAEETFTKAERAAWSGEITEVKLENGETIMMTTAQKMSIYCLQKRQQAQGHLLGGGIRVADITGKFGKKISQADNYVLTVNDIAQITGSLTKRQREVADALQQFMNTVCSNWGNEISMKRFGFKQMTEMFYFPIETDANNRRKFDETKDGTTSMFRLLNMSSLKPLTPNANNAIVIHDIFNVFSDHASNMAKYNALALPILDFIKWYNYVERSEVKDDSGQTTGQIKTRSVQKTLERAYGKDAKSYLTEFIRDLNAEHDGGRNDGLVNGLISRAKSASVGANVRVYALQVTSLPRAAYAINPVYLAQGATMLKNLNPVKLVKGGEAQEEVGILKWKSLGFYSTDIARSTRSMIKQDSGLLEKLRDWSIAPAGWGDNWVSSVIYEAVKIEMQKKRPELRPGSADYKNAVNERVREIIYKTQVVDSTMTRSELMRSKGIASLFTAFMTEPTLTINMLNEGIQRAIELGRKGENFNEIVRATGGTVVRAAECVAVSAFVAGLLESVFDALRDDDEYEKFIEKFTKALWISENEQGKKEYGNFLNNLNPITMIPILNDGWSIIVDGYEDSSLASQVYSQIRGLYEAYMSYKKGNTTLYNVIYKGMQSASSMSGVALANAMREVQSVYNTFLAPAWGTPKWQTYEDTESTAAKGYYGALITGDTETAEYYKKRMDINKMDMDKVNDKVASLTGDDYVAGKITEAEARNILKNSLKLEKDKIDSKISDWSFKKETGFAPSKLKDNVIAGAVTKAEAIKLLMKYDGISNADATEKVNKWLYEKTTERSYDDLKKDYIAGKITESQLRKHLKDVEGLDDEKIEERVSNYDYTAYTGKTTTAPKYWRLAYTYETGGDYEAYADQIFSEIMAGGKTWKQARSSIASSIASYYKKDYLAVKGTQEGDRMLEEILDVYEAIGYDRSYERNYIAEKWVEED